jgi:uncharacterized protein YbjT (DUF2867 family)
LLPSGTSPGAGRPDPDTLVTGATGFIGRWLLLELTRAGRQVAVLLRRRAASPAIDDPEPPEGLADVAPLMVDSTA